MTLKLSQLEAFYWAASLPSFSVAASRLHLSQSSLSKRIAELETQLGKPLFDRSGHRSTLTPAGTQLLPLAHQILRSADQIFETMSETPEIRGACKFGVGELAALSWLPRFVMQARDSYPDLVLEPHVDLGRALEIQVEMGELDFAVIAGTSMRTALSSEVVGEVRFHWVGAPKLIGKKRSVTRALLAELPVITMPSDAGSAREFDNWLVANNFTVNRRLRCNNLAAITGLVAAGIGISFIPEGWLEPLIKRGDVVRMTCTPPLPTLFYSFQCRKDDIRPLIRRMRDLVRTMADFSVQQ